MNYADIKQYDVANGPGVRVSLFVSGCSHQCKGCFNPETWDFEYGNPYTKETEDRIIEYLKPEYVKGLTLLGGDPLERCNQIALLPTVKRVKELYPKKDIWCYTGYDFEKDVIQRMVPGWEVTKELLTYIDVMIDGEFIQEKKDLSLVFRGSSNQRIIKVQETLAKGSLVLWEPATRRKVV